MMNTLDFHGSKVEEDLKDFIVISYKVSAFMGLNLVEKVEFVIYQLKRVALILFNQWKETRLVDAGPFKGRGLRQPLMIGSFLLR